MSKNGSQFTFFGFSLKLKYTEKMKISRKLERSKKEKGQLAFF